MIKVMNWEYEYGMKLVAFYKEIGHEIEVLDRERCIHFTETDVIMLQLTKGF